MRPQGRFLQAGVAGDLLIVQAFRQDERHHEPVRVGEPLHGCQDAGGRSLRRNLRFGFIAAAYTTLASYLALMLAHWLFMRRVLREQKITEKVYDSRAIFLICGAVSAVAFASMLTYHSVWLQVGFLLILAGLCWWKKDLFLRVMKDMKKGA